MQASLCTAERLAHDLVVKVLLGNGANPNCATKLAVETGGFMRDCRTKGETPLHRAAAFGPVETIQMLLDARANIEANDMNGERWPAVILLLGMLGAKALPMTVDGPRLGLLMIGFMGLAGLALGLVGWWLFFSRAKWSERLLGLGGLGAIAVAALFALDKSMHGGTIQSS